MPHVSSEEIEDHANEADNERPRVTAIRRLGARIVAGEQGHEAGDVLPLSSLMAEFGASRPLAREVLQALEHKGMVTLRTRVGATVQPLSRWNVLDPELIEWRLNANPTLPLRSMTELREAIEPRAAFLAAQRASAEVCQDVVKLAVKLKTLAAHDAFEDPGETGEAKRRDFQEVDAKLHCKILEGSNNELFVALAVPVEEALRFRIERDWEGARRKERWAEKLGGLTNTTASAGSAKRFPMRPERLAMWFHCGMAYAIAQQHPRAAETFSRAIIAEIQEGRLNDPYLRDSLRLAMRELDHSCFPAQDRDQFFDDILAAVTA